MTSKNDFFSPNRFGRFPRFLCGYNMTGSPVAPDTIKYLTWPEERWWLPQNGRDEYEWKWTAKMILSMADEENSFEERSGTTIRQEWVVRSDYGRSKKRKLNNFCELLITMNKCQDEFWFSSVWFSWFICLRAYQLFGGYLMPKFKSFVWFSLVWFGLVYLFKDISTPHGLLNAKI